MTADPVPLRAAAPAEAHSLGHWDEVLRTAPLARGVLSFRPRPASDASAKWIEAPSDPARYARGLYASLRALDESGCDEILVEEPPASAEWAAVRDRLARACSA